MHILHHTTTHSCKTFFKMNIPHGFIHCIIAHLANRRQFVCHDRNCCFYVITTNTGAPQGTVPAAFIFTLYTAGCRTQDINYLLIKFADYTAMIGLIHNNDDMKYQFHVRSFVDYCNTNYLQLNIIKTKELIINIFQTASPPPTVVMLLLLLARIINCQDVVFDE